MPELDCVDALHSPRRTILDALLVDAARTAGAEGSLMVGTLGVRASQNLPDGDAR
jgi:hypothetical protein